MTKIARAFYLAVLLLITAWHASTDAQVRRWAHVQGSPCCGAPAHFNRYLDANEACQKETPTGPPPACWVYHQGTIVAAGGPQPTGGVAACAFLATCVCGNCLIGTPDNPSNTKCDRYRVKRDR